MKKRSAILGLTICLMVAFMLVSCDAGHEGNTIGGNHEQDYTTDANQNTSDTCNHSYTNGICEKCHESLWSGEADTSWYSVVKNELVISTSEQLAGFAQLVNEGVDFENVTVKLAANMNLNQKEWTPIFGTFLGTLDGDNHSVSNFTITDKATDFSTGFFVNNKGTIRNLKIKGFKIEISQLEVISYVGGIAAINSSKIENCCSVGSINVQIHRGSNRFVGGLAGANRGGIIDESYADVNICVYNTYKEGSSSYTVGGLVGSNSSKGVLRNSYSTGNIEATLYAGNPQNYYTESFSEIFLGGLAGSSVGETFMGKVSPSSVINCYASGSVTGKMLENEDATGNTYVGGLLGYREKTNVTNCFAIGNVQSQNEAKGEKSENQAGGLIGYNKGDKYTKITNCYYSQDQMISPADEAPIGTAATIEDFHNPELYKNRLNWDIFVWRLSEGKLPTLK